MEMKTYPYHTPDGIIELVEKREYDLLALALHDMQSLLESEKSTRNHIIDLQDVVKRMEEVSSDDLDEIWFGKTGSDFNFDEAMEAVRTRLISAAKGES